jgi:hypothetical protein|eukprot:COSAG01_NODE_6864_length_3464_cov_509.941159_2_plen_545_part_00
MDVSSSFTVRFENSVTTDERIDFDRPEQQGSDDDYNKKTRSAAAATALSTGSTTTAASNSYDDDSLLICFLCAPVIAYYLGYGIAHFTSSTLVDSEGCEHRVRQRLVSSFGIPWLTLFVIDFLCLCPAHYWLTMYSKTHAVAWARHGNARDIVEDVATSLDRLTLAETLHFSCALMPILIGLAVDNAMRGDWQYALIIGLVMGVFAGGQLIFGLLSRPRSAIVRFRGPGTPAFAWGALKGSLGSALCILLWGMRGAAWWMDHPVLPVRPPAGAQATGVLQHHPLVEGSYLIDLWQGFSCQGRLSDEIMTLRGEIAKAPWVINVSSCDSEMFIDGGRDEVCLRQHPNATLPSMWTADGFRHFRVSLNCPMFAGFGFLSAQVLVGAGMFSTIQHLRYGWAEVSATFALMVTLGGFCFTWMRFYSTDPDPRFDWGGTVVIDGLAVPISVVTIAALVYRDSIAELARSRSKQSSRWVLSGQYCAFLSHYKNEAAADARHVKDKLVQALGAPVFLDSDDLMDLRNLCHQVSMSDVLLLFQTRDLLTRPW